MKRCATAVAVGLGFILAGAAPAEAQLFNFPVYGTPSAYGMPSTYIAGTYGGGLNDASGKENAIGAAIGRTGIGGRVTVVAGGGLIMFDPDSEVTLGGGFGIDLLPEDASAGVALQGGIGWMGPGNGTLLHFPVGVSLRGNIEGGSANVSPWVMPRLSIVRASASGFSNTETDFGASGGVSINMPSGLGFHVALDMVASDPTSWLFGGGVHYVIP